MTRPSAYQFGPWSWPLVHAWAFAADWLTELDVDAIWNRTAALTTMLKTGLKEISGARLLTPELAARSAALCQPGPRRLERRDVDDSIAAGPEHHRQARSSTGDRASARACHSFSLEEEVELLVDALSPTWQIAAQTASSLFLNV